MRNKDKHKKKSKHNSPKPDRRNYSKERGHVGRSGTHSDAAAKDDYGFLGSAHQQGRKEISSAHSYNTKNTGNWSNSFSNADVYKKPQASPRRTADSSRGRGDQLEFYSQVAERRSRSTSRASRQPENYSSTHTTSRPDRSRSKSRDIVTLYTSSNAQTRCRSATPVGSLKSYIYVPPSKNNNHQPKALPKPQAPTYSDFQSISLHDSCKDDRNLRSRSLVREPADRDSTLKSSCSYYTPRARSETRSSSVMRDAVSLCSNLSTQSRALSNSEIVSQNLELWISTMSKKQKSRSKSRERKRDDTKTKFVTLLEMDDKINAQIEKELENANSVKPTNIKMMAIAGHTPSDRWESNDELKVKPGDLITGHYKQNEWLYASLNESSGGYVPYAYTKAIKLASLDESSTLPPNKNKSTSDRLDYRSYETEPSRDHQSYPTHDNMSYNNHKPYRDSLSSTNSAFLEEIMCVRPSGVPRGLRQPREFADCLVVDADNNSDGLNEDIKVCSDSGISEPNSNHSDEPDPYVSPANHRLPQHHLVTPGSRSSLESSNPQEDCRARRMYKNFNRSTQEGRTNHLHVAQQIDSMPFGLLGKRLEQPVPSSNNSFTPDYPYPQATYYDLSQDMKARAQPVMDIPLECKPQIPRDYNGPRARVAYDYMGMLEDDVVVKAGEVVTVLNSEDIEWIWVMRKDGVEGFMPREYVISPELSMLAERTRVQQHMLVSL